jgi:hypothetical protein
MGDMTIYKRGIETIIIEWLNHCNRLYQWLQIHAEINEIASHISDQL